MTYRKIALYLLLLLLTSSSVGAQGVRNGITAAPYLLIPQGARFLSGGGAAADVTGLESIYWNPAGLVRSEMPINAIVSRRNYLADIDVNFVGASLEFERLGSIALTIRNFNIGEIPVTTSFYPDGTGGMFEPTILALGTTYSKMLNEKTSVGFTMNYLRESFSRVQCSGFAFDFGVQYSSFMEVQGWSIGVVLRNFGMPLQYTGSGLWRKAQSNELDRPVSWYKVEAAKFDLPSVVDVGTSYRIGMGESNSLQVGATYESNHSSQDEYKLMGEYDFGEVISVRGAYVFSSEEENLENIFASYSLGGSLNLQAFAGIDLSVDYSFTDTEYFNDIQVFALRFGF